MNVLWSGIKENWAPLFLAVLLVLTVLSLTWYVIGLANPIDNQEFAKQTFEARNLIVQECLKSDLYTRDECIALAAGQR